MSFSTDDLPDLTGATAVVTGANSGIGLAATDALASAGAEVVLACRNLQSAREAAARIEGPTRVEELDLASQKSVRRFAERWAGPLDLLVNNAGVMTPPHYRETEDGFELQFGTNHLGHFALTARLLPALLASPAPRVVTVSSIRHHAGDESVLEGNPETSYRPRKAYGNSKLANLLFARELQRRATEAGSSLVSTAAHPGISATGLVPDPDGMGANRLLRVAGPLLLPLFFQSARAGALPTLYAATLAEPGSYSGPQRLGETRGRVGPARVGRHAGNDALAEALWKRSEELTGLHYSFQG